MKWFLLRFGAGLLLCASGLASLFAILWLLSVIPTVFWKVLGIIIGAGVATFVLILLGEGAIEHWKKHWKKTKS